MYTDALSTEFRPEFVELESGVLTDTCGAVVVVVITKTDEKPVMAAEEMNRLQYQIRKFCLAHGAALVCFKSIFASFCTSEIAAIFLQVYTSAKNDINTQLLRKYIAHRVYGVAFTKSAHIVDEASVFIPSGWDTLRKLDLERESLAQPDLPLTVNEDAIAAPVSEKPIECPPEQEFLIQLTAALTETPSSPKREREPAANIALAAPPTVTRAANASSPLATYFSGLIKQDTTTAKQ